MDQDDFTPRILVPGRVAAAGKVSRSDAVFAGTRYLEALDRAGGLGCVVRPVADLGGRRLRSLLHGFDGLLLVGGPDVDPARYGAPPHPCTAVGRAEEDDFEVGLVRAAAAMRMPTLAICRGMQVMNVAFGGTLDQHVPDGAGRLVHAPAAFPAPAAGTVGPAHPVRLLEGSRVRAAMGRVAPSGAHAHHQAVERVGTGLVVTGWAADGVVEAIEARDGWMVGVQWHPEDTAADDPAQQGLFEELVRRARAGLRPVADTLSA